MKTSTRSDSSGKKTAGDPTARKLRAHIRRLRACERCPKMIRPVITGEPVPSPVMLVGQAPGIREGELQRPFAWTAGKTLFKWIESMGLEEADFRRSAYMAAVCRCFPGKNPKGGDRVPDAEEIANCGAWLDAELALIKPRLVLAVGKLAIGEFAPVERLTDVVGQQFTAQRAGTSFDLIALPHPSGASTWHRMEPGKSLLAKALRLTARHPAWKIIRKGAGATTV